jgi:hypothetical protein
MIPVKNHYFKNKYKKIIILLLIIFLTKFFLYNNERHSSTPRHTAEEILDGCVILISDSGPYKEVGIKTSGRYCINNDIWQKRLFDMAGHTGPSSYRHLVDVSASDVEIDLRNNTIRSDGHSSGIFLNRDLHAIPTIDSDDVKLVKNITIRNGTLDIRGLGSGVALFNKWRMSEIDERVPEIFNGYQKTKVTLENLLIKTDNIGVILEGDGNTIRNCTIESGGVAAITIAGPNTMIINNRILLKNPSVPGEMKGTKIRQFKDISALLESRREPKAAIVLHNATGSVISGNRIEVVGKSQTRHNIYITDESMDVRIQENTFLGPEDPVTSAGSSTAIMINNIFLPEESSLKSIGF